jgi:hypothetical protein
VTTTPLEAAPQPQPEPLLRVYLDAARRRERPARHLAQRRDWVAALRLYLEAAVLLLRAQLVAAGDARSRNELPPCDLLDALLERSRREGMALPAELERLRPLLSAPEWDALDRLSEPEAERASDELAVALRFLAGTIPVVRQAEQRRERRLFAIGASLLALGALGALLWSVTRPSNLALNHPVTATPAGFATEPAEAVNGVRFGELGYHSADNSPWLQVDLEAKRTIQRVQIYGRGDCCFDQSIPLLVEGSSDGKSYVTLGELTEAFRPFRPWVLALQGASARYIRLRPARRAYLVIAELEVY